MDLDHANKRLMAALVGLAAGKQLDDFVAVPGYGQSSRILDALKDAAVHLDEDFHEDEFEMAGRVLTAHRVTCASRRKSEIAKAVINAMFGKPRR